MVETKPMVGAKSIEGLAIEEVELDSFADLKVKTYFIQKIYIILAGLYLLLYIAVVLAKRLQADAAHFVQRNQYIVWLTLGILVVLMIAFTCLPDVSRKKPLNFIVLGLFGASVASFMITVTYLYNTAIYAVSLATLFGVCLLIALLTSVKSVDPDSWWVLVFVIGFIMFVLGILAIYLTETDRDHNLKLIYAAIGLIVYSFFMFFATDLIVHNVHRRIFSADDYVYAATHIFVDILGTIYTMLQLMSQAAKL